MTNPRQIDLETFIIDGKLGPFQNAIQLNIAPMTVFIGPQGTGKSLVSQLLYFFRDAEYLLSQHYQQQKEENLGTTIHKVIGNIRSGNANNQGLSSFLKSELVTLKYSGNHQEQLLERGISLSSETSSELLKPFDKEIESWLQNWLADPTTSQVSARAIFAPAERTFFSHFINSNPNFLADKAFPLATQEFAKILIKAAETQESWQAKGKKFLKISLTDQERVVATTFANILIKAATKTKESWPVEKMEHQKFFLQDVEKEMDAQSEEKKGQIRQVIEKILGEVQERWQVEGVSKKPPIEFQEISELINEALGIQAIHIERGKFTRHWQVIPQGSDNPIGIDLASSGQMSTWPLIFLAQAMFDWNPQERPQFLHIEEPEIHLHPTAQLALVKVLAYLVNKGFRLVITTHSLYIVYALNNLILAHQKLGDKEVRNMPKPTIRLAPEKVSAYLFAEGQVQDIMKESEEAKQIDESLLEKFLGDLDVEQNKLLTYKLFWE